MSWVGITCSESDYVRDAMATGVDMGGVVGWLDSERALRLVDDQMTVSRSGYPQHCKTCSHWKVEDAS
jgi:hypothetical protein